MMKIFWVALCFCICEFYSLCLAQNWEEFECFSPADLRESTDPTLLYTENFLAEVTEDNSVAACQDQCQQNDFFLAGVEVSDSLFNCFCWNATQQSTHTRSVCTRLGTRLPTAYRYIAGGSSGGCDPPCGDICDDAQVCQCADDYTLTAADQSCFSTLAEPAQPPSTSVFTVFGDPHVTVTDPTNNNRFCFDIRETQSETLNILENEAVELSITGDLESCGNNMSCLKSVNIVLGDAEIEFTDSGILSNGDASYYWDDFTSYRYQGISVQSTTGDLGKQKLVTLAVSDTASVQLTISSISMAASLQFMGIILHNQDGLEAADTDGALGQFIGVGLSVSGDELTFSPSLDQASGISSVAIVTSNRYDPVSHERPSCYTYNGDDSHDLIQDDLS